MIDRWRPREEYRGQRWNGIGSAAKTKKWRPVRPGWYCRKNPRVPVNLKRRLGGGETFSRKTPPKRSLGDPQVSFSRNTLRATPRGTAYMCMCLITPPLCGSVDNKWLQQQIPACRPVFTALHAFLGFLIIGIAFIIIGAVFTAFAERVRTSVCVCRISVCMYVCQFVHWKGFIKGLCVYRSPLPSIELLVLSTVSSSTSLFLCSCDSLKFRMMAVDQLNLIC